jgi:hypothetical protein
MSFLSFNHLTHRHRHRHSSIVIVNLFCSVSYASIVGVTAAEIAINRQLILIVKNAFGLSFSRTLGLFALYTVTYTGAMYLLMEYGGDAYDNVRNAIGALFNRINPFKGRRRAA